ncbi:terminase large subunit [Mesonia aquimarina]|uniref:terminase large subunit n=1 Tax=Mesonia aquimarina TaxID=1504967 RepID=UPI000EF60897|nr:terminase TerL endonuclease subunit [Mesonia aquimarina]
MKLTKEIKNSIPFQYAYNVRDGKIITGKRIKQAVNRFFSWIETAEEDGYYLDHNAGLHIIDFFELFLTHTKGEKAINREAFILSPYQQFTLYNIMAWKGKNNKRRIRTVYEKVARKNGKTAVMAGLQLYFLCFDDEASPEVYSAATKEQQAKIVWEQAYDFVLKSLPLRKIGVKLTQREIRFPREMGKIRFLGGDSKTQDGLNISLGCLDEYHAFKDDSVREVIESAMGARKNPLLYIITTAGFNMQSVCKAAEDVYIDILEGHKKDDHIFIMIHDLDEGDDWENTENWEKANPNLNVSVYKDQLESEYTKAVNQPSKIPNFKTKHLNMWVDAAEVRIPSETWAKSSSKIQLKNFIELGCAAAFDLSSTTDLTSIVFVSNADENGYRDLLPFNFCPKDTIDKRSKEDRVPYRFWKDLKLADYIDFTDTPFEYEDFWKKQPVLTATEGNQIDYAVVRQYLSYLWDVLQPKWYEYDPWKATELVQNLQKNAIEVHPFPQTITHFSFPTTEFETLAFSNKFRHGGHPILAWTLSGCVAYEDPNENIRYVKNKSTKRIDPIIATIMALAGTITEDNGNQSKYNNDNEEIFI